MKVVARIVALGSEVNMVIPSRQVGPLLSRDPHSVRVRYLSLHQETAAKMLMPNSVSVSSLAQPRPFPLLRKTAEKRIWVLGEVINIPYSLISSANVGRVCARDDGIGFRE